jgi:hypothetical protein
MLRITNRHFNIAIDMMHYECDASAFACAENGKECADGNGLTDNKNLS